MLPYDKALRHHLAKYKEHRLGVRACGTHLKTGLAYAHILPLDLLRLNILETIRSEFFDYLSRLPAKLQLHRDFHHLNSSQALAFNLFFPFLRASAGSRLLLGALGLDTSAAIDRFHFEYVPDANEATNVDVAWTTGGDRWTFCEVKLSEQGFGRAKVDERHLRKLDLIYRPRLTGLVDDALLEPRRFFESYQILRNISLLSTVSAGDVLFLLPRANGRLRPALEAVRAVTDGAIRARIHVVFLEDVLDRLGNAQGKDCLFTCVARQLREKYIPTEAVEQGVAPDDRPRTAARG